MNTTQIRSILDGLSYPANACAPNLFWEYSNDWASDLAVMDWKKSEKKTENMKKINSVSVNAIVQ